MRQIMRQIMRRISLPCYLLLTAGLFTGAPLLAEEDAALEEVRAKVDEMFPLIRPEHVNRSPVEGWFTVQKGSIVAYVSADGRFLLQGDLIDLDQNVNLTEQSRAHARRDLMGSLADDQLIVFTPPEVKHSVTIFTDVDCGYCRKLHSEIDDYLAAGIEIRYMLYPRNGPRSPSWGTAEKVWCATDRNHALTAAKLGRDFTSNTCDASVVSEHYAMGQDVGLSGTPAIVFDDGTLVSGYLPAPALEGRLQAVQQAAAN